MIPLLKKITESHFPFSTTSVSCACQLGVLLAVAWAFEVRPIYTNQFSELVQLFSIDILREYNAWEVVYFLHAQPPLLNFLASLLVKNITATNLQIGFYLAMLAVLGLNILVVNKIVESLKIPRIYTWPYILSPAFLLYHTWYYEPVFSLFFTNLLMLSLTRSYKNGAIIIFTIGLVGLSLCHGIFQPIVMLVFFILGCVWIFKNGLNKKNVIICLVLIAIPLSVAVKNHKLVGIFGTSSWSGCNVGQKWPNKDTWVMYQLENIGSLPSIIGSAEMSKGKPNYNNIDFGRHCINQLKQIAYEVRVPSLLTQYFKNVGETIITNESKLSLFAKRHCCGLGGEAWGKFDILAEDLLSLEPLYGPVLLFINLFLPLSVLVTYRNRKYLKEYGFIVLIYYWSLLIGHMANGQEQERMGFRNSFFIYLCLIYVLNTVGNKIYIWYKDR